jgi:hypothetical protein
MDEQMRINCMTPHAPGSATLLAKCSGRIVLGAGHGGSLDCREYKMPPSYRNGRHLRFGDCVASPGMGGVSILSAIITLSTNIVR